MKKIWMTSTLSLALLVSAAGPALAANPFTDLKDNPAKTQIEALASKGIINGLSDQLFGPDQELNTAQGVTLIARSMQLKPVVAEAKDAAAEQYFTVIDKGEWFAASFDLAHANGVDIAADVDPSKTMTKEQYVSYLVQAMEKSGYFPMVKLVPVDFADDDALTPEYQGAVQRALHYGIVSLDDQKKLNPQAKLTRSEAAVITHKAVEVLEKRLEQAAELPEAPEALESTTSERWMNVPEGVIPADNE
jgi:hypothetical protein